MYHKGACLQESCSCTGRLRGGAVRVVGVEVRGEGRKGGKGGTAGGVCLKSKQIRGAEGGEGLGVTIEHT